MRLESDASCLGVLWLHWAGAFSGVPLEVVCFSSDRDGDEAECWDGFVCVESVCWTSKTRLQDCPVSPSSRHHQDLGLILLSPNITACFWEVGGPVALVLRSKLQELAKTSSAQRAAQRWQVRNNRLTNLCCRMSYRISQMFNDLNGPGKCKNTVKIREECKTGSTGLACVVPWAQSCSFCQDLGNAKVLMPENTIPWGVTHFIGPTWTDSLVSSVTFGAPLTFTPFTILQEVLSWANSRSFATAPCCNPLWIRPGWLCHGCNDCNAVRLLWCI